MNKLYAILMFVLLSSFLLTNCGGNIKSIDISDETKKTNIITSDEIKTSVVRIRSKGKQGSGFVVGISDNNDRAYIITVYHVVEEDSKPMVEFFGDKELKAEIIDSETQGKNGLVLLSVKGQISNNIIPLYLNKERNLKFGDEVYTFGFPIHGIPWAHSVLRYSGPDKRNLAFSDSNISKGNSGCPLIIDGQIVAVITTATRYAFATSSVDVRIFLNGVDGGKQILKKMESWHPNIWSKTQAIRLEKAKEFIGKKILITELDEKIIDQKNKLEVLKNKRLSAEQNLLDIRIQTLKEGNTKMEFRRNFMMFTERPYSVN